MGHNNVKNLFGDYYLSCAYGWCKDYDINYLINSIVLASKENKFCEEIFIFICGESDCPVLEKCVKGLMFMYMFVLILVKETYATKCYSNDCQNKNAFLAWYIVYFFTIICKYVIYKWLNLQTGY